MRALKENLNISDFFRQLDQLDGNVRFLTDAGDDLDLSSELCRFVAAAMLSHPSGQPDAFVVCENGSDYEKLAAFLAE